jgi:hypothetical protein
LGPRSNDGETASSTLGEIIERVDLMHEGIRLLLKLPIAAEDRNGTTRQIALARLIPLQLKRRGVETRMVLAGEATPSRVELPLLKAVARARRWALERAADRSGHQFKLEGRFAVHAPLEQRAHRGEQEADTDQREQHQLRGNSGAIRINVGAEAGESREGAEVPEYRQQNQEDRFPLRIGVNFAGGPVGAP